MPVVSARTMLALTVRQTWPLFDARKFTNKAHDGAITLRLT